MKKCSIYCDAESCKNYAEGFCNLNDTNRVTMENGVPTCADYTQIRPEDKMVADSLLNKIKAIYASIYDGADLEEDMEVDLNACELCTDKDHNCFILKGGSDCLQELDGDARIAALIDARNVLIGGNPANVTFKE